MWWGGALVGGCTTQGMGGALAPTFQHWAKELAGVRRWGLGLPSCCVPQSLPASAPGRELAKHPLCISMQCALRRHSQTGSSALGSATPSAVRPRAGVGHGVAAQYRGHWGRHGCHNGRPTLPPCGAGTTIHRAACMHCITPPRWGWGRGVGHQPWSSYVGSRSLGASWC